MAFWNRWIRSPSGRIGAGRSAYATVLFPVIALGLSTLFEGYVWTPGAVTGVGLVLLGNALAMWPTKALPEARASQIV